MVYGQNPYNPLDLTPFPTSIKYRHEVETRVKEIKKLHDYVREKIAKANEKVKERLEKKKRYVQFKPHDMVRIHLDK